ncbi:MAG TPA: hypothetical protein DD638_04285 [Pasteurellaceae bacterium]|nr:hypothetical protein [Pasteurellaceae bacterium]
MITITPISESALVCQLPAPATLDNQRKLWAFAEALTQFDEIAEVVVGMNNVTIFSKIMQNPTALASNMKKLWAQTDGRHRQGKHVKIPVHYGGQYGEDLSEVARFHHTTVEQIVRLHSETVYTVYMIGFQPGFPYLGGLPETLHTPRRATPRTLVPAGSVGIGGSQTGVYPFASPGGWQLIGRTTLPLFDQQNSPPTLLQAGDTVQFIAERVEL